MAGSAALIVLAATQVANPLYGILYVLLFGISSMLLGQFVKDNPVSMS